MTATRWALGLAGVWLLLAAFVALRDWRPPSTPDAGHVVAARLQGSAEAAGCSRCQARVVARPGGWWIRLSDGRITRCYVVSRARPVARPAVC